MKSILCCHSKIRGHKPVGQVVSFSVTNEIPCSFLPDDSVWLLECSHVRGKYGQEPFYESKACQVFILHVVGIFVLRSLSALFPITVASVGAQWMDK